MVAIAIAIPNAGMGLFGWLMLAAMRDRDAAERDRDQVWDDLYAALAAMPHDELRVPRSSDDPVYG